VQWPCRWDILGEEGVAVIVVDHHGGHVAAARALEREPELVDPVQTV
jgi:hypothetical protein